MLRKSTLGLDLEVDLGFIIDDTCYSKTLKYENTIVRCVGFKWFGSGR
jgi:hypothetical protein